MNCHHYSVLLARLDHFTCVDNLPLVLTELRKDEAVHMDYSELLSTCKDVEISVSEEQAKAVEAATRDQASSKLWFRFRAVVWTEKDLHVECILFDEEFWDTICQKSKNIFDTAIMPELVGKFYTRLSSTMANVSSQPGVSTSAESHGSDCAASASGQEETWCFCGQVEFGKMILCDNAKCHIKWFHYSCINVKVAPKGKWYCPKCQKLPKFEPKKGKKPLK
uniref:PHD-type domain-containing protein n=1 Tax=Gadus morhua TaxID=8049 RepID=A0A8C5CX42_GADMO